MIATVIGKSCAPSETWILFICGGVGLILGVVTWAMDVPDFPAHDWLNAAAVGIVSGWAATGLNQSVKQLSKIISITHPLHTASIICTQKRKKKKSCIP